MRPNRSEQSATTDERHGWGWPSRVLALGFQETTRLTTHPLVIAGSLGALALSVAGPWASLAHSASAAYQSYETLTVMPSFLLGPLVFFAANLTASRDRRAGTTDLLTGMPTSTRTRTAAALLAALGPATLTVVVISMTALIYRAFGAQPVRWPTVMELAMQPARVLGAGLLGVMIARWLPRPGSAAIVMVALYGWHLVGPGLADHGASMQAANTVRSFAPFREVLTYGGPNDTIGSYLFFGSIVWHNAYLLCLGAMAATGALLATRGPRRLLLLAGAAAVASAVFCGWRQLP